MRVEPPPLPHAAAFRTTKLLESNPRHDTCVPALMPVSFTVLEKMSAPLNVRAPLRRPRAAPEVPTERHAEVVLVEFSRTHGAVPPVMSVVPAAKDDATAVTVHVDPSVHVWPLTVVAGLTRSAFVTRPVAVRDPVTVNPAIVGEVARTTLPLPIVATSANKSEAPCDSIRPMVPPPMVVVPTVIEADAAPMAEATPLPLTTIVTPSGIMHPRLNVVAMAHEEPVVGMGLDAETGVHIVPFSQYMSISVAMAGVANSRHMARRRCFIYWHAVGMGFVDVAGMKIGFPVLDVPPNQ